MSLINQALKLEQQRRHTSHLPQAPMVSRLAAQRHGASRWPMILFGITGMGALLAVSITAILYFGRGFLDQRGETSLAAATEAAPVQAPPVTQEAAPSDQPKTIENLVGTLSAEQLATVQQMLLEKDAQAKSPTEDSPQPEERATPSLSDLDKIQKVVDGFSVQGIRKAGQDSRVFLNGKIQRIGDTINIEHGLVLIGFTDSSLVFRDASGHSFEKTL